MHIMLKVALVFILKEEIVHIMLEAALVFILKEEIVHIVLKVKLALVFILNEEIVHIMLKVAFVFILIEEIVHIKLEVTFARSSFRVYFEGRDCAHSAKSSFSVFIVSPSENQMLAFFSLFFLTCSTEIFETSLW